MAVWFTSDQHFWHENIIEYCGRPFKNAGRMNDTIIRQHNELVMPDDTIYYLGDLSLIGPMSMPTLEGIIKRLNGNKIFIYGNHDKLKPFDYEEMGFKSVHTRLEIEVNGYAIQLLHDPAAATYWDKKVIWLCGHVHNIFKRHANIINVGVDVWNFNPVSEDDLEPYIADILELRKQ